MALGDWEAQLGAATEDVVGNGVENGADHDSGRQLLRVAV